MKILKFVLVIVGVGLVLVGLYNAFMPQEVLSIGSLELSLEQGLTNQSTGMIGLGALALSAAFFAKNRR
jgi:hypothetical protein|tara:strand:- start:7918 stop:8124 length:207 start_codon:yes stop_codon:yes gene_type:complete